jgi:flagellar motor switch protein FliG
MFRGGVKEAAKLLLGLGIDAQKKILAQIKTRDPKMAEKLEANLIGMDDLEYITASMLVGLLRDVSLEEFGLALRTVDSNIVEKLLGMVSTGIKLDIEDGLKGKPRKVSDVEAAQENILKTVRDKVAKGHIVLNHEGDTLV